MATGRQRAAIQGWDRLCWQRQRAVFLISLSLPIVLGAGAFFLLGGIEVSEGNFAGFAILMVFALVSLRTIGMMESEFKAAELINEDVKGYLAWSGFKGFLGHYSSNIPHMPHLPHFFDFANRKKRGAGKASAAATGGKPMVAPATENVGT
jgi:hypothetical protein